MSKTGPRVIVAAAGLLVEPQIFSLENPRSSPFGLVHNPQYRLS